MALVRPVVQVDLGLTAGFYDALSTVAWTDITDHVVSWGTSRGREPKRPPAHFDPGQASLVLDNRDRSFDPTNSAGAYWPNLKPAKVRLQIRANWPSILTPDESSLEGGLGGWTGLGNAALTRSTLAAAHGAYSLRMTAIAAGAMTARSSLRPVTPGTVMKGLGSVQAGTGTPTCSLTIGWYDEAGVLVSSAGGAAFSANTGGFTQATVSGTVPAGVAFAALFPSTAAGGPGENAYWDCFSLHPGTGSTWISPYAVFTGYVKRWPPEWTASATSTVKITAVDALGAPLNLPQMSATPWQTVVRTDRPKVWLRLGESQGPTAVDSTSNRHDGQYQGTPEYGRDSLVSTDTTDKAIRFPPSTGARVSLPYKNLILDYPFTFEAWFRAGTDTTGARMFFSAYDGPNSGARQFLQIFTSSLAGNAGKIVAVVTNPYPTGTQIESSIAVNDNVIHHVAWVAETSTSWKLYIDGVDRTVVTAANAHAFPDDLLTGYAVGDNPASSFGDFPFGLQADDVLDEVAIYDTALSAARVQRHYQSGGWPAGVGQSAAQRAQWFLDEVGFPGADVSIDTTASSLQVLTAAGGVVANLQKVEDAEQGAIFVDEAGRIVVHGRYTVLASPYSVSQVSLGQQPGDLPYEPPLVWGNDDAELYNQLSGSRVGGPTYTMVHEASRAEYGERPLGAMDGMWNAADGEVVDLLTYRVDRYAEPTNTVRAVTLHPAAVPDLFPYVLRLGLRSRVTVDALPPGGGPVFAQPSHLERIGHTVDDKGDWWTSWEISAADTATYLVLDDPVLGLLDSGNKLSA